MIKKFSVDQLDSRYKGSSRFKYRVGFLLTSTNKFDKYRNYQEMFSWLWDTYGPGCERDHYVAIVKFDEYSIEEAKKKGPQWAYYVDKQNDTPYLYIRTDELMSHINLKWTA